ncbi:MAG: ABC transporter substrate-binding protein [Planctomycetota bacterium]
MTATSHIDRLPIAIFVAMMILLKGSVTLATDENVERAELPKLIDMQVPSVDELFSADEKDIEYDWILLKAQKQEDRRVIVVQALFPRPDTIKSMLNEASRVEASKPTTAEEREKRLSRLQELKKLIIKLPGDLADYRIPIDTIDSIIYFEDLMLQRVDRLIDEGNIQKAYELLLRVENGIPDWDKSQPRYEQLLLAESAQRAAAGDAYAALALLDELAGRNKSNEELRPRLGQIVAPMIEESIGKEDFRKARYLISRVERVFPDHELVATSKSRLNQMMSQLLEEAGQLFRQRKFPEAAETARRADAIWTMNGNQRAAFTQYVARHQVLRAGFDDTEVEQSVYPASLESRERLRELVEVPLYEPSSADKLTYYRSSFFEVWNPTNLGREVLFSLRSTRPHWQSQPILTANDLAETIDLRLNPDSPLFDPRLASFVKEISVRSPTELRLRFSRVPLSIESLMRFPVIARPPVAVLEGSEDLAVPGSATEVSARPADPRLLSTRFREQPENGMTRSFMRVRPEPDGLDSSMYHIAEVREVRYEDRGKMLQAAIRGDIDYIPTLQPWEVDAFRASSDFETVQYSLPITHVITFNPLSERVVNAQMRRALSFAVNREGILSNVVLRDEAIRFGRPTSAAWALRNYATEPNQVPPAYNLRLAYALRFAAERQLQIAELMKLSEVAKADAKKNKQQFDFEKFRADTNVDHVKLPKLRFVVDPDPTCIAAAERMMVYWKKINFDIELIRGDQSGEMLKDDQWDMCYRRVRMEEPLLEIWPLLANSDSPDMSRLALFPDWMRQELVGLDYASSFLDAQQRLFTLHNHIAEEAFLIPLWEVDQFAAVRKTVVGVPQRPMSTYQNVERWIIRP